METSTPCPFWEDGIHCFRDDSRGGVIGADALLRLGMEAIPVKQCACGAEVKGKPRNIGT